MDAQLVGRFLEGDIAAFDDLVHRHRDRILRGAYGFTENWDEAEDLAQEIFLQAYRSLGTLKDPQKFGSWLTVLANRMCSRWTHKQKRRRLILDSLCTEEGDIGSSISSDPFLTPDQELVIEETRSRIRSALDTLSQTNRETTELFYVDGLSLEEISHKQGIPVGTVKQRLHQSRMQLWKEMLTMPDTVDMRTKPARRPLLQFALWGYDEFDRSEHDPFALTRSLLAQQILLSISKRAKREDEIAKEVGADVLYISDHLQALCANELALEWDGGRVISSFFVFTANDQKGIRSHLSQIGKQDAMIIVDDLPKVVDAFKACRFEEQGFGWDHMKWIIVPVFLSNIGIRRQHPEVYIVDLPLRPGGGKWFFFGMEEPFSSKWVGGCNYHTDPRGDTAHFWTPGIEKASINPLNRFQREVMFALTEGPRTIEEIQRVVSSGDTRAILAKMCQTGYVVSEGDRFRLDFPVVQKEDDERLAKVVDAVCGRIVRESRVPGLTDMDNVLDNLGFSHLRDQYAVARAFLASTISGYCIEHLVDEGVLGDPPKKAPANWAFWGWIGHSRLMDLRGHAPQGARFRR